MKISYHPRYHWISVAFVSAGALLAIPEVWGQTQSGAGAMFEGRPAMAGAQGGQGAQAGMAQGGLGVQGNDATKNLNLRKPSGLDSIPPLPAKDAPVNTVAAAKSDVVPPKEQGLAREQRSAASKAKKAAKKTAKKARTGVTPIDAR